VITVDQFEKDGFQRVCVINDPSGFGHHWQYSEINQDLMFSDHRSWVYFVVVDREIWKVGETGNPLGIRYKRLTSDQPIPGSRSRLGRYRFGDATDEYVREELAQPIRRGARAEFWAKLCPIAATPVVIAGETEEVGSAIHKELEIAYLDWIWQQSGTLPALNKSRK